MRLIVTGATGLAGAEVVRQGLADGEIEKVTALVRRPLSVSHEKLATVVHGDFLNYDAVLPQLADHDACLWCLGVSQRDVAEPEYIRITRDYTLAGAAAMLRVNPGLTFGFLSGGGASSSERSPMLFGRVKGQTENRLGTLGLSHLYHFRPGYIEPSEPRAQRAVRRAALRAVHTAPASAAAQLAHHVGRPGRGDDPRRQARRRPADPRQRRAQTARSLGGKAVEQPVAAGAAKVVLTAAARGVREVPRRRVGAAALAIVMPDKRAAVSRCWSSCHRWNRPPPSIPCHPAWSR